MARISIGSVSLGTHPDAETSPVNLETPFRIAILGDFLLQLLMLSGILLGMYLLSTKFSSMTSFALTYAAVVMVFPLVATVILGKELKRQARSSEPTLDQQVGDVSSR